MASVPVTSQRPSQLLLDLSFRAPAPSSQLQLLQHLRPCSAFPALPIGGIDINQVPSCKDDDQLAAGVACPTSGSRLSPSKLPLKRKQHQISDPKQEKKDCDASAKGTVEGVENGTRISKKLKLSKEQWALLHKMFKEHSTLTLKQKVALAKQLGTRPRQVEVWFQNRRARNKMKQSEVDCKMLIKFCESLTQENQKLQWEVQELRAINAMQDTTTIARSLLTRFPAATLTMCPSCESICSTTTAVCTVRPNTVADFAFNGHGIGTSPHTTSVSFLPMAYLHYHPAISLHFGTSSRWLPVEVVAWHINELLYSKGDNLSYE